MDSIPEDHFQMSNKDEQKKSRITLRESKQQKYKETFTKLIKAMLTDRCMKKSSEAMAGRRK